jgi:hypothetical protein
VDKYEGTYVSTGRTLAEVINLPATILFKMSFMSGILDHSEGPVTNNMKEVFKNLVEQSKSADAEYNSNIKVELAKLDEILK